MRSRLSSARPRTLTASESPVEKAIVTMIVASVRPIVTSTVCARRRGMFRNPMRTRIGRLMKMNAITAAATPTMATTIHISRIVGRPNSSSMLPFPQSSSASAIQSLAAERPVNGLAFD